MTTRLYYIDALRSFAMLFGVLLHSGTLADDPLSAWVETISQHFRMATFFAISGILASVVARRRGDGVFVAHRARNLLIPLAFGLVVLNPVTNWLVYVCHGQPIGPGAYLAGAYPPVAHPGVWHLHLWFLISLSFYVLLVPPLRSLFNWPAWQRGLGRIARQGALCLPLLALIATLGDIGGRAVWRVGLEPYLATTPMSWIPRVTLSYAVYFMIGMAALAHRPLFEAMHRLSFLTYGLGAALYLGLGRLGGGLAEEVHAVIRLAAQNTVIMANLAMLLFVFRRFLSAERSWITKISRSSYTIYIVHYLLIYVLALTLAPLIDNFYALYGCIVLGTGLLGYAFHRGVVERFALMMLAVNGKTGRGAT